jgi:8-oxo-dGTP pyrophosphatase MutT (NUDIX family)
VQEQEVIVQAATNIFVREQKGGGLITYMIKRPETMRFLPGYHVFPGGVMDESDQDPRYIARCAPVRAEQNPAGIPLAYWITALRETFEEAGILLAYDRVGRLVNPEQVQQERELLLKDEVSFYDVLEQADLQLATDRLRYFGHRITPRKLSKRRFETRFFLTVLPDGLEPVPHTGEVASAGWIDAASALAKWDAGEMKMVPPTVKSLQTIDRYQDAESLWHSGEGVGTPTPEELE